MLEKVLGLSPGQLVHINSCGLMDTMQKGSMAIAELANILYENIIPIALKSLWSLTLLATLDGPITALVLVTVVVFCLVSVIINHRFSSAVTQSRNLESESATHFWETIKHASLVVLSAMQTPTQEAFAAQTLALRRFCTSVWLRYTLAITVGRDLPLEIMLGLVFMLLMNNADISLGDVAVAMSLVRSVFESLGSIGHWQRSVVLHCAHIVALKDVLAIQPQAVDIDHPIVLSAPKGDIQFEHVTFSYDDARAVLTDVSFHINSGETVALVGQSGSGKSTILSLLLRSFRPQNGRILVDDIPLDELDIRSWRRHIGLVPQSPKIWDASVRDNIVYGSGRPFGDEELQGIANDACIGDLGLGLDTLVGENGVQLSGGQCQRIAIARVMAKSPRVVIFDEATSALDYETEARVFVAMKRVLAGRTGLVVAHRLGTVRHADRILVLHGGQVVGSGTFDELQSGNPHFQNLIRSEIK